MFGKNYVERLSYAVKNPLQLPMDSREGLHCRACHGGQCKVLKLQPFRSVLDPIRMSLLLLCSTWEGPGSQ